MQDSSARFEASRRRYIRMRVVAVLLLLAIVNIIVTILALIHPVPSFALSASLFYIQSTEANAYSKRSLPHPDLLSKDAEPRQYSSYTYRVLDRRCGGEPDSDGRCTPLYTVAHNYPTTTVTASLSQKTTHTTRTKTRTSSQVVTSTVPASPASTSAAVQNIVDAGSFVSLWVGVLGICLQRASGSLICTGASLTPNFESTYAQSRLGPTITSRLPQSTSGPTIGFVIGIMLYGIYFLYLLAATITPTYIWSPYGNTRTPAARYHFTLGLLAMIAASALFSVAISAIILRNSFTKAVTSIGAIDTGLTTKLGSSFGQLYAVCAIGGLVLLTNIVLLHLMGEKGEKRRKITAAQDYNFDLMGELHALSVAGSQLGGSRAGSRA